MANKLVYTVTVEFSDAAPQHLWNVPQEVMPGSVVGAITAGYIVSIKCDDGVLQDE